MTDTEKIADVVVAAVRAATKPLADQMAGVVARLDALDAQHAAMRTDHGAMRTTLSAMGDQMTTCTADTANCLARVDALAAQLAAYLNDDDGDEALAALVDQVKDLAARAPVPGPPGATGPAGMIGMTGATGPAGQDGRDGQPGVPGRDGAPGPAGDPGTKGQDGRDGTLEGVRVEQVDDRTWKLVRADGSPLDGAMAFSVPLYRGVYVAGTSYAKGDAVTFGGSLWLAREGTAAKPGDGATAWQLAVKAGRDGREGKAGPTGQPGAKGDRGEPGRDYR